MRHTIQKNCSVLPVAVLTMQQPTRKARANSLLAERIVHRRTIHQPALANVVSIYNWYLMYQGWINEAMGSEVVPLHLHMFL